MSDKISQLKPGKLILIGCGPGSADLLTLRAVNRIQNVDLVLYDRLVDQEVLDLIPSDVEQIYVGKENGDGGVQQSSLNNTILENLKKGKRVARLKSGDPMVFGRAAEEIEVAAEVNAEVEIVPGVTAALAAASESIITVTERSELQSFIVTTGKAADRNSSPDWSNIVKPGVCVAFYMGVGSAWKIQSSLMAAGVPENASADWVERAGQTDTRIVRSSLGRLANDSKVHNVKNPAILLVRYPYSLQNQQNVSSSTKTLG